MSTPWAPHGDPRVVLRKPTGGAVVPCSGWGVGCRQRACSHREDRRRWSPSYPCTSGEDALLHRMVEITAVLKAASKASGDQENTFISP